MNFKRIIPVLFYLIAIAVSIKSFREPDLWWQIRTGEWIMEHHEVPKQDIFSYTMTGTEWINIKWGFEVLIAFIADHLGPESVFILQAIVNCLLVFFLLKLSLLFFRQKFREEDFRNRNAFLFSGTLAFLLLITASEYRMVGRPEMISHLMTVIFLYLFEKNRRSATKEIFLLIPLQLLWANLHEAFGIGIVLLLIYTASAWIEDVLNKDRKTGAKRISLISLAAIASVVINPYGLKLMLRPFNIMSQVYVNKYTTELFDFTAGAWWRKEAYIGLLVSIVSILVILVGKWREKNKSTGTKRILGVLNNAYLICILAFLFLGMSAYRNLVFLSLVCFPVFHLTLFMGFKKWPDKTKSFEKISLWCAVTFLLLFYAGIVSGRYYSLTNSRDRFGLEVLSVNNPAGAADYILQHHLKNKKCFSDYLTSSYLLWKLQPEFKTYIDLRDLDIYTPEFFNGFLHDVNSPPAFHQLDSLRHFEYAVLFRPQFDVLHSYLYNDSVYALTYLDAVAAVYEKTDDFSRGDIFTPVKQVGPGAFANAVNKILNPFYTGYHYAAVENDYIAANYYLNVGRLDLARKRAQAIIQQGSKNYKGNELLGQVYFRSAMGEMPDSVKSNLLVSAEESYRSSLESNAVYAPALLGLGAVHFAQKNYAAAIKDFSRCLAINEDNYQAHLSIAQCYRELMSISSSRRDEYRKDLLSHFLKANALNPGNPMVEANIGFIYFQMNDCDHVGEFLNRVSGDKSLSAEDQLAVQNCLRQCGY